MMTNTQLFSLYPIIFYVSFKVHSTLTIPQINPHYLMKIKKPNFVYWRKLLVKWLLFFLWW